MTTPATSPADQVTSLKRATKLYRIAGCLWAIVGLYNAITGASSRVALSLTLCAVSLALGASKARKAAAIETKD